MNNLILILAFIMKLTNSIYCSGQKVTIEEKQEGQPIEEFFVTIQVKQFPLLDQKVSYGNKLTLLQGLTSSGYLLAADDDDNNYELHPDGNS